MYKHKYNKTILDLKIRNTKSPDSYLKSCQKFTKSVI